MVCVCVCVWVWVCVCVGGGVVRVVVMVVSVKGMHEMLIIFTTGQYVCVVLVMARVKDRACMRC